MTHSKQEETRAMRDNVGGDQYLHVLYFVEENQLMFVPSCISTSFYITFCKLRLNVLFLLIC